METTTWTDRVRTEEVFHTVREKRKEGRQYRRKHRSERKTRKKM